MYYKEDPKFPKTLCGVLQALHGRWKAELQRAEEHRP